MLTHIRPAIVMIALMTLLTGLIYPFAMTGLAQAFLAGPAGGSVLRDGAGKPVGSVLIGQGFAKPEYLHGRPSAAGSGYDPTSSSGSNLGPLDPKLSDRMKTDAAAIAKDAPGAEIPPDAVAASGSGLDPDVSPEFARLQAPRIAAARGVPVAEVESVIDGQARGRTLAVLGEAHVNVLLVNRALDARHPLRR